MAEYDEIKVGNLYKIRTRMFSDTKYKIFLTQEEVKLHEVEFLILTKMDRLQETGIVGGVEIHVDGIFMAHFLPVKKSLTPGDDELLWKFPTTTAEFWERFDCVDG